MACRIVFRTFLLAEKWLPLPLISKKGAIFAPIISFQKKLPAHTPNVGCKITVNAKGYHQARNCWSNGNSPPSSDDAEQGPAQEAVLKAISGVYVGIHVMRRNNRLEVSKAEGRVGQTTNVVIGGTVADDSTNEWLALDQKVNSYPTVRGFTAIETGGDDFVQAMVVAVESVLQEPIPEGQVKQKISSGGKYVSVNIGPVQVVSSEQVQAVYNAMRSDDRMKYFW